MIFRLSMNNASLALDPHRGFTNCHGYAALACERTFLRSTRWWILHPNGTSDSVDREKCVVNCRTCQPSQRNRVSVWSDGWTLIQILGVKFENLFIFVLFHFFNFIYGARRLRTKIKHFYFYWSIIWRSFAPIKYNDSTSLFHGVIFVRRVRYQVIVATNYAKKANVYELR